MCPYPGCRCSPKRSAGSITYYSTRHLLLLYVGSNAILHHSPDVRAHVAPMFRAKYGFADELHATLTRRDSVPIRLEASLASICTSPEIFTCAWCLDSRDPCPSVVAVNSTPITRHLAQPATACLIALRRTRRSPATPSSGSKEPGRGYRQVS